MIKRLKDVNEELETLRSTAKRKGELTGFNCLDEIYSIKDGSYTFVLGSPTHGKSEFIFELLLNQARKGKRSLIYSPETGNVAEIIAELVHKITGKSAYLTEQYHCSETEYYKATAFIDWHFLIVDSEEKAYSISELFQMVDQYEIIHPDEPEINYIMAEPYNEIKHDMAKFGTRQDLYIEEFVGDIRRYCKKKKKHAFISLHPTSQHLIVDQGISYYPKPLPREAAGGQALFRKAMCWLTVWRPPVGLESNGRLYVDNEAIITVDKAKPKGVAMKGDCTLHWDFKRNRYFEEFESAPHYAFDHEITFSNLNPPSEVILNTALTPNHLF